MSQRPRAPGHLDATARATWKKLIGELPDVEPGTLLAFEQFCFAWSKWRSSRRDESQIRWSRCCRQWAAELKLTPRSKATRKATEESADPILKLIHRKAE